MHSRLFIVSGILGIMAMGFAGSRLQADFIDVPSDHHLYSILPNLPFIGYPDGSFQPEREVTGAEFSAVTQRILGDAPVRLGTAAPMLAAMLHSLSPTEELAAIARINEHYGTHMPLEPDAVLSRESLAALIYIVQNNAVHASAPQEVIQIETEPQQSWWMKLLPW